MPGHMHKNVVKDRKGVESVGAWKRKRPERRETEEANRLISKERG